MEFAQALFKYQFLQYALLTGLLASIACGIMGTYIVTRRITYIAGGIAHTVLGGMGIAQYLQKVHHLDFLHPIHGAIVSGIISALVIGFVSLKAREREDTVIGAIWAIGMAVGIIFISKTPGYSQDLMSYLFGNILIVSKGELKLIALLDMLVIILSLFFYNHFSAITFDEEFARIRGIPVNLLYMLLLTLTALTIVILVTVVGIIMVIALLTIPVAIAGSFSRSIWHMMLYAILLSMLFTSTGLALSYSPDLPAGATIIILSGTVYLLLLIIKPLFKIFRKIIS